MTELTFGLRQVEVPLGNERRPRTYDTILDSFLFGRDALVEVHVEGKEPRYVKEQLNRRIQARFIEDIIEAKVINGVLYLEK